jgi:hypothetical protein
MSRTVERLRDTATAMGAAVTEEDLPELRLPEAVQLPASRRWAGGRWLIPVIAATAVLVAIGSATLLGQHHRVSNSPPEGTGPTSITAVAGAPRYLVTSQAGQGYVRSVATGRTIARIPAPGRGYKIEGIAAAPGDRVFYLVGEVFGTQRGKLELFGVRLGQDGRPQAAQRLPGPPVSVPLPDASSRLVGIPVAVSPDGHQIAYALPDQLRDTAAAQPAEIVVRGVATGTVKIWDAPYYLKAEFSQLSWAAGGQLAFVAAMTHLPVSHGGEATYSGQLNVLGVLDTLHRAGQLLDASRLITTSAGGQIRPPVSVRAGLITADGQTVVARIQGSDHQARLVEISVATGKVTRVLRSGERAHPIAIDGDYVLVTLAQRGWHGSRQYACGNLALARLSSRQIAGLPAREHCDAGALLTFDASW